MTWNAIDQSASIWSSPLPRSPKIGSNFYRRPRTYPWLFDENPWRLYISANGTAIIFHIVSKASKRLYLLFLRLKRARVSHASLITVYTTYLYKGRLHRRLFLRSFSFWCMRLNRLTCESFRPSMQSYINQYFCDSIACVRLMRNIAIKIARVNGP